jgi:hypothetical protein
VTFTSADPASTADFNPHTSPITVTDAIGGAAGCFPQTIPIEDDFLIENAEEFTIEITAVSCDGGAVTCTIGVVNMATVAITDNDTPPGNR